MIESTQDILNLVKAFGYVGLFVVLVWSGFYVAMLLKSVYQIVRDVKNRVEQIDRLISIIIDKAQGATSNLGLIVDSVSKVASAIESYKKPAKKTTKK
jgi:endonuclease IV